jgi:hypothetical protein
MSAVCTAWLGFSTVSCGGGTNPVDSPVQGLGGVELNVSVLGTIYDETEPQLILTGGGQDLPVRWPGRAGGRARTDLSMGSYDVWLVPVPRGCLVPSGNPQSFIVESGLFSAVDLTLDCSVRSGERFERWSEFSPGRVVDFGHTSERFVVREDGSFSLQTASEKFGSWEYSGHYALEGSTLEFMFDFVSGSATGTLLGNCMTVHFNAWLGVNGYEDGIYCRP